MAKTTKKKETGGEEKEIVRAAPTRAMSPFEEIDRMFESMFPRGWLRPFRWERPFWSELGAPFEGKLPRVDIVDRDAEIMVHAEIPGVSKDDLEVSLTESTVTLKGSTGREEKEEKGDYYRCEISRGAFSRTLSLPGLVDTEKAKATFKDGVLELTLPKLEKAKRRSVPVE